MLPETSRQPDILIELPMPPGANERTVPAIHNATGKPIIVLSKAARQWLKDARLDIFAQRKARFIVNRAVARVSLSPSNYDADAPVKLLFDALEKGGAVGNDKLIRPYFVCDDERVRDGWLRVELWDSGQPFVRKRDAESSRQNRTLADALVRTFGKRPRFRLARG